MATVEVFIDGVQVGAAQNPQKKMAQKLAARNALAALKEKEVGKTQEKNDDNGKKNGNQTFTRQTLNDICLRRNWPMPFYRYEIMKLHLYSIANGWSLELNFTTCYLFLY